MFLTQVGEIKELVMSLYEQLTLNKENFKRNSEKCWGRGHKCKNYVKTTGSYLILKQFTPKAPRFRNFDS